MSKKYEPKVTDHFREWLRLGNQALRAYPSSPKQKELSAQAAACLMESKKKPTEHKRRLDALMRRCSTGR